MVVCCFYGAAWVQAASTVPSKEAQQVKFTLEWRSWQGKKGINSGERERAKITAEMCDLLRPMTDSASTHRLWLFNRHDLFSKVEEMWARLTQMMASGKGPSKTPIVLRREMNPLIATPTCSAACASKQTRRSWLTLVLHYLLLAFPCSLMDKLICISQVRYEATNSKHPRALKTARVNI